MAYCHVAHDCVVGDDIVMSNNAGLAGHVIVENRAIIGAMAGVLQFTRIGEGAMIGGMCGIPKDVIPFGIVMKDGLAGLNLVGLQRAGVDKTLVMELQKVFKELFLSGEGVFGDRLAKLVAENSSNPLVQKVLTFCQNPSKNGILHPERK